LRLIIAEDDGEHGIDGHEQHVANVQGEDIAHGQQILMELVILTEAVMAIAIAILLAVPKMHPKMRIFTIPRSLGNSQWGGR
jgi:hypothetical protein